MTTESDLLQFMNCETLDSNLFRGESRDLKTGQVYGGQVLGQAIKAAQNTVDDSFSIHSAHAYFLRRGDVNAPIIYEVDRSRDGRSFASRRVVAIQHGHQIFHLSASFQIEEEGLEFYEKTNLPLDILQKAINEDRLDKNHIQSEYVDIYGLSQEEKTDPHSVQMWIKAKDKLPEGRNTHCAVLAYVSDMGLLMSAFMPHFANVDRKTVFKNMIIASLDHAIWFHRPFRADEWFFYDCRTESTGNSRGFAHGRIYTADGVLVASTTQEGLMRQK